MRRLVPGQTRTQNGEPGCACSLPGAWFGREVYEMCILCGEMIMTVHWTDQPVHDANYRSKTKIVAGENQRERMRLRLRRVAVANKILSYYGLTLKEWNGSRYMLFDKKGASRVIYDLGGMWKAASEMAHRDLDPLDPDFLKALQEGTCAR